MIELVLATANPHKVEEIAAILGPGFRLLPRPSWLGEVEEDGETLADNARLKASAIAQATGLPALADDTGLFVDALGGQPGVRSARYAGEGCTPADNVAKLLAALATAGSTSAGSVSSAGSPGRAARFATVALARWPDGTEVMAEGVVSGEIASSPRGDGGFGYDPVFIPSESGGLTFAEMTPDQKNAVSHRSRAFRSLAQMLESRQLRK